MMELTYAFMDPTGNMTVLVEQAVPTAEQPHSHHETRLPVRFRGR